jgi:hypothetical protein
MILSKDTLVRRWVEHRVKVVVLVNNVSTVPNLVQPKRKYLGQRSRTVSILSCMIAQHLIQVLNSNDHQEITDHSPINITEMIV